MTDRPIIFSAPMVRALLDGRKTQDRRALKPQPRTPFKNGVWYRPFSKSRQFHYIGRDHLIHGYCDAPFIDGDRLWVREPWQALCEYDKLPPRDIPVASDIIYTADRPNDPWLSRYRHARFMPRWASRLTLVVTQVRVQRLQDISKDDADAEGVDPYMAGHGVATRDETRALRAEGFPYSEDYRAGFQILWNSLHGHDAWDANPWVTALTFTVHRANIDGLP